MNKLLMGVRRIARSGVVTMLLLGIATPACTNSHALSPAAAANTPVHAQTSSVRQNNDLAPVSPLVFIDESHKSLLVESDDELAMTSSEAIYIEEPLASGYVPVSDNLWEACEKHLKECTDACNRKRKPETRRDCFIACNKKYYTCLQLVGLVKATFNAFDAAWSWIKDNKTKVVGAVVIIGGIAYIVSTSGTGALILIPLGA